MKRNPPEPSRVGGDCIARPRSAALRALLACHSDADSERSEEEEEESPEVG